jgi:hypothetical protein
MSIGVMREQERHRREMPPRAHLDEHRGHGKADDVVRQHRGEYSRRNDNPEQKRFWSSRVRRDPSDRFGVEAAQPELRGDDHQAEQQRDRVCVDGEAGFVERQTAAGENRNRTEQRDTAAIEGETRNLAQDHPGIDQQENGENQRIHAVRILNVKQPH